MKKLCTHCGALIMACDATSADTWSCATWCIDRFVQLDGVPVVRWTPASLHRPAGGPVPDSRSGLGGRCPVRRVISGRRWSTPTVERHRNAGPWSWEKSRRRTGSGNTADAEGQVSDGESGDSGVQREGGEAEKAVETWAGRWQLRRDRDRFATIQSVRSTKRSSAAQQAAVASRVTTNRPRALTVWCPFVCVRACVYFCSCTAAPRAEEEHLVASCGSRIAFGAFRGL